MEIATIIEGLRNDNSRKGKEEILTRNKNNTLLRSIMYHTYNPHLSYFIRKIPPYTHNPHNPHKPQCIGLSQAVRCLSEFSNRTVTGNAAIARLGEILSQLEPRDAKIFECIVTRDLRCGVSEATINKVWKDLVPSYPCLLATADGEKARAKIRFPAIAQEKCDGMRINAIVRGDVVEYRSRNGLSVDCGSATMSAEFVAFAKKLGGDFVFDGELLVWSEGGPMSRKVGNGVCNKAIKGTVSDGEREMFVICVWDAIPYADFLGGRCAVPYAERYERFKRGYGRYSKIQLVPTWEVSGWGEAKLVYGRMVSEGGEGLIIKNRGGVWEDRRSGDLVKMKEELVCDLIVREWVSGTGKYVGKLGSLVCEGAGSNPVRVSVGTGFSDSEREAMGPREVVGRIVSVIYNEVITAEDGSRSLFLPRFDTIREDKNVPDTV